MVNLYSVVKVPNFRRGAIKVVEEVPDSTVYCAHRGDTLYIGVDRRASLAIIKVLKISSDQNSDKFDIQIEFNIAYSKYMGWYRPLPIIQKATIRETEGLEWETLKRGDTKGFGGVDPKDVFPKPFIAAG